MCSSQSFVRLDSGGTPKDGRYFTALSFRLIFPSLSASPSIIEPIDFVEDFRS
jgi:hypothetical protein